MKARKTLKTQKAVEKGASAPECIKTSTDVQPEATREAKENQHTHVVRLRDLGCTHKFHKLTKEKHEQKTRTGIPQKTDSE